MGLLEQVTLSGTDSKDKNISKYFYNNAGVQIKMYTGMSSENDSTYLTTNYEYDNWLRAVRTTDSTGYNSGTITYDLNGNVLTNTDANGNVTTNTYDALNRVLTSKTVNSKDSSKNVSKSYEYDNMGRISRAITNDLTTTYSYDDLGRKSEEIESKDGYSTFKGFFYEGVSQYTRQQIVGINNLLMYSYTSYEYDGEMRLIKVKETGEETVSYTYDRNGNKKSETLANGVISTYDYNNANRIVKLVNKKGNSTISSYEYSYYLDGSDACKVHSENGIIETTEYEYDGLKRLTQESVAIGNSTDTYAYEYDDYGNRSKMTAAGSENYVTEYNYNNAQGNYIALLQKEVKTVEGEENPLDLNSNVKQTVYTYDANGNQITKTAEGKTETNTYDSLNQLIGFTDGETTASYAYNVDGLRYEKIVDGQRINHVWDGSKQIIADVIDNQFYEADCYIRGTNLVAKYNYRNGNKSEYTYYTQNAHGDVVNLTNANGEVTKTYKYNAFGVEKDISESDTNAFRYCGEYYDSESGTIYLRARYYDPTIGRFISRDSFAGKNEDPLSLNLYTYCANNPIVNIDPTGHFWNIVVGAIGGALLNGAVTVASNLLTGEKWNEGLGQSLLVGAASGALASCGAPVGVQLIGDMAISAIDDGISQYKSGEKYSIWGTLGAVSSSALTFGLGNLATDKLTKGAKKVAQKGIDKANSLITKAENIKNAGGRYWKGAWKKGQNLLKSATKQMKRLNRIDNFVENGISFVSGVSYNCLTNAKKVYNNFRDRTESKKNYYSKRYVKA